MDDLTKELKNVNYRAAEADKASEAYRVNTHDRLDAIAKSIEALTKKLGDYHKNSVDVHLVLALKMDKAGLLFKANTEQLKENTEQLKANTKRLKATDDLLHAHGWSLEVVDDLSYMRPGKLGGFEKKDVKDPVNLKL
jgi:hypothetical protein